MTYTELLRLTGERKLKAIKELSEGMAHPQLGFLCRAEIRKDPGKVAWLWLAESFCKTLAEHWDEVTASVDDDTRDDLIRIYMAYEDSDPYIYDLLPIEAQLFD